MKLTVEEKVSAKIVLPDMTIDLAFLDDLLVSVGPVRTTKSTPDSPAGTVIMPMQVAGLLERIVEAVRVVRKGRGDYRTCCPLHGYQSDGNYLCTECEAADRVAREEKAAPPPPAPKEVPF